MKKTILVLGVIALVTLSAGCSPESDDSKSPVQVEQQTNNEVPAIKVIDNKLFVDDKEMLANDFLNKYCFAKKDNQNCLEAQVLRRIQNNHTAVEFPKGF